MGLKCIWLTLTCLCMPKLLQWQCIGNNPVSKIASSSAVYVIKLQRWCVYLGMPAGWDGGLSVPLSVGLFGWSWCPYQRVKAPSASGGYTDICPACQPLLHWGSVVGNLQSNNQQNKMHKVTVAAKRAISLQSIRKGQKSAHLSF